MTTAEAFPKTFADVLDQLGGIPPDRVLLQPFPGTATEADVLAARYSPGRRLCELIDGVLVQRKEMSCKEAFLAGFILRMIGNFLDARDLGIVTPGDSQIRFRIGLVRIPDVSFIPWTRIPGDEVPNEPIPAVIPALTVEVLSRSNTPGEIDRKVRDYFEAGVKLTWVIEPREESARVYTAADRFKDLKEGGVLEGGRVLPGFRLPLADLFAATKRRKQR